MFCGYALNIFFNLTMNWLVAYDDLLGSINIAIAVKGELISL